MEQYQKAKELVRTDILQSVNMLIEAKYPYWFEDAENLYYTNDELLDMGYDPNELESVKYEEMKEVFEFWLVTDWLASKLREYNEVIIEVDDLVIWGRTCTGQAIYMDDLIQEIAEDYRLRYA